MNLREISNPYGVNLTLIIKELTLEGVVWLMDSDGNQFLEPINVDQLKKFTFEIVIIGCATTILVSHTHYHLLLKF